MRSGTTAEMASASTALRAEVVTSRKELELHAPQWNELLASSRADAIFLTWEWLSTWLDTVYPEARLFVVVVRERGGRLVAAAPFYRSDLRLLGLVKYRCLRVIGDCQSGAEYGDIIVRHGFEDAAGACIVETLLKDPGAWDCLWFCNVAGWTGAGGHLRDTCQRYGLHLRERARDFSFVKLPPTHAAYLGLLSRNAREQVRRKTRRFQESHDIGFVRCAAGEELPLRLADLFVLHRQRWESVGQRGSFVRRPPMQRFYESFAPVALRRGWLRLYSLRVDGRTRAVQYGYAYGGAFHQLQEGYEPEGYDGIGNVLRNLVVEKCIEEGLEEYDFLGEFTEHKRRWGAQRREGSDLLIGRRSLKNRLLFSRRIWPGGRFLKEGRPASEGRSHD
jgi:CelD/BcsL family acetyltransferase involved in cellulose biosynthesis